MLKQNYTIIHASPMLLHNLNTKCFNNMLLLGMPPFQKSAAFLNIVQKAFDPPPFYLNICPILQGVFFMLYMLYVVYVCVYVV